MVQIKKKYTLRRPVPSDKNVARSSLFVRQSNPLVWTGIACIMFGVMGLFINWLLPSRNLSEYLTADIAYYVQINPAKIPAEDRLWLASLWPSSEVIDFKKPTDFSTWLGSEMVLATTTDNKFLYRFRYHSRAAAKKFLAEQFLLPEEQWMTRRWSDPSNNWEFGWGNTTFFSVPRTTYNFASPSFSSPVTHTFAHGYLWIASDSMLLEQTLSQKNNSLSTTAAYQKSSELLASNRALQVFVQTETLQSWIETKTQLKTYSPVITALVEAMPALIVSAHPKSDRLQWQLRLIESKPLTDVSKLLAMVSPELASFSPANPILFLTGQDIRSHYEQTKLFLATMHPQFSLIFDGVLQAQAERVFGDSIDFYADFLSQMSGQYAVMLEQESPDKLPAFTLVSEFGRSDVGQKIRQFQDVLRFAQGKSQTKIIKVDLPGGQEQDQVVSIAPSDLVVNEALLINGSLYSVYNPDTDRTLYFGFRENYFVFSVAPLTITKIFSGDYAPLSENEAFRDTVLFEHQPAVTYGYITLKNLQAFLDASLLTKQVLATADDSAETDQSTNDLPLTWLDQIETVFTSLAFSQKNDEQDVWWEIDLIR